MGSWGLRDVQDVVLNPKAYILVFGPQKALQRYESLEP